MHYMILRTTDILVKNMQIVKNDHKNTINTQKKRRKKKSVKNMHIKEIQLILISLLYLGFSV